jgi:hypothetical protein
MYIIDADGKKQEVEDYDRNGSPIIQGDATSTQDGYDDKGYPKLSVNINVPPIIVGIIPGKNGE